MKSLYKFQTHEELVNNFPKDDFNVVLCEDNPSVIHYGYVPYDHKIEFLERTSTATNTQYISTNYIPKGIDIRIEGKFMPKKYTGNYGYWFGGYTGENNRAYRIISSTSPNTNIKILAQSGRKASGGNVSVDIDDVTVVANQVPYEFILDYDGISISKNGGEFVYYANSGTTITTENTSPLRIFTGATNSQKLIGRFYYLKLYKANNLVLDLIPVRKNGVGYAYDKVSDTFCTNTGTFTLGPDI